MDEKDNKIAALEAVIAEALAAITRRATLADVSNALTEAPSDALAKHDAEKDARIAALEAVIAEAHNAWWTGAENGDDAIHYRDNLDDVMDRLWVALSVSPSDALARAKADTWDEGWEARDDAGVRKMRLPPNKRGNPYGTGGK